MSKEKKVYYELPVYNAARRLSKQISESTHKMSRDDRVVYVIPMLEKCRDIIIYVAYISKTDEKDEKIENINHAIKDIYDIAIINRWLFDLHHIKTKGHSAISTYISELTKQLIGWRSSFLK